MRSQLRTYRTVPLTSSPRQQKGDGRSANQDTRPPVEALRRHYEALGVVGKQCGSRPRIGPP